MIKSLEEYTSEIKNIISNEGGFNTTTLPWFRGQSDENWELFPSLYRLGGKGNQEREMIRDFKLKGHLKIQSPSENNLEVLFTMQHYGIPTRLLDWTESYLIALYFAVLNFKSQCNSAVWILFPWDLNEVVLTKTKGFNSFARTIPSFNDKRLEGYSIYPNSFERKPDEKYPIAIRPIRTSDRIIAQKGMFTIHGHNRNSLNSIIENLNNEEGTDINLIKLTIAGDSKLEILRELFVSGITHSILFPELEGICQEIAFRYSDEFTGFNDGHKFLGFK